MTPLKLALLGAAASLGLAAPAAAQMNHANMPGMNMPGMKMPVPAKKPAAKKPVAKKPAAKKSASKTTAAKKAPAKKAATKASADKAKTSTKADPHAGHDMSSMPGMQMPKDQAGAGSSAQSMSGHDMSSMPGMTMPPGQQGTASSTQATPSMPGHDMSNMPGMNRPQGQQGAASSTQATPAMPGHDMSNMPGHDMSSMPGMTMPGQGAAIGTNLPAGNAPPPPFPIPNAADQFYGREAMEMGRHHLQQFHGGQKFFQALVNIAELQARKGRDGYEWDGEAWYGGDINRLWLKSEGEGAFREGIEKAEVQALYSRAVGPYFNLQGGVRYDFKPNPSRVFATVGVEGLAPSFFDVEGALFLSNKGELLARAEGYYDQRITQRLILQPRAELNFAAQSTREIGVGSGLSDAEIGLRMRYEFRREFAPYVGVQYRRAFGRTRDYLREAGEATGGWSLVTGIRTWF